jgi:hypothetical protein
MLNHKKILLEYHLKKARQDLANMHLGILVSGNSLDCNDYRQATAKVTELEAELKNISCLAQECVE